MKRIYAALLSCLILISSFCACSMNSDKAKDTSNSQNNTSAPNTNSAAHTESASEDNVSPPEKVGNVIEKINNGEKEYTLMVYMNGSDLETHSMSASNDIEEMLGSGLDTSKVNLVIYTGGTKTWHLNISNSGNSTLLMHNSQLKLQGISEKPLNMGDPDTLSMFLNESYQYFPAKHYGLILWDHGKGPLIGFGSDENFDGDSLEMSELNTAMNNSPFDKEHKLDFVGFDACLMSSIEVADTFKKSAHYLIASQESEPGMGWDYSFLSEFNQTSDPVRIADRIIQNYHSYYEHNKSETISPQLTMSCIDLSKIDKLNNALDNLFSSMNWSIGAGHFTDRVSDRIQCKSFGEGVVEEKGWSMDMVDIGDLAEMSSTFFESESKDVLHSIQEVVINNKTTIDCASGISIYYPFNGPYVFAHLGRTHYSQFKGCPNYINYINSFTNAWSEKWLSSDENQIIQNRNYSLGKPEQNNNMISIQLTDNQQKNYLRAYLHIFADQIEEYGEKGYFPLLTYVPLDKTKDGIISFDIHQKIPVANDCIFPLQQLSSKDGYNEYQSIMSKVSTDFKVLYTAMENVRVLCSTKGEDEIISINSINYDNQDKAVFPGKNTIESDHWHTFSSVLKEYIPKTNLDGSIQAFSQWEKGGSIVFYFTGLDKNLEFKMKSLDTLDCFDTYCQVVMEGMHGELYASEMIPVFTCTKPSEYTESFGDKGKATYEIYPDHAVLKSLEGNEKSFTIPYKIKNVPVTTIQTECLDDNSSIDELTITNPDTIFASEAFYSAKIKKVNFPDNMQNIGGYHVFSYSELQEINFPSSLKTISESAFCGCMYLKKIKLPSGIEEIGVGAFSGCIFDDISFDGPNANYKIEGKNLYSINGKILFGRYENGDSYTIKEGVEEIAPYACSGNAAYKHTKSGNKIFDDLENNVLRYVTLPQSLKKIDHDAFRDTELVSIDIPDNVTEIGHNAFSSKYFSVYKEYLQHPDPIKEIHFGKNVKWIGKEILGLNEVKKCTVSDGNNYFSAKDNKLYNKHGDSEIILNDVNSSYN